MSTLQLVQQDFQGYVLGQRSAADMQKHVAERPGLSIDDRLSIYYNAYRIRLSEALSDAYEKTHIYLGDALFENVCRAYIDAHPSQTRNMRWFGAQFAPFLKTCLPDYPVVAELAEFEWTLNLAFDAADEPPLSFADLGQISEQQWNTVRFQCVASHHFLHFHWNAVAIWLALNKEESPPEAEREQVAQTWLIWRNQLQPNFRSIAATEYEALSGMQAGQSFSEVCATAAANNPEAIEQIAGWLQSWIGEAVLAGFK